jgi:hypothetical protein
MADYRKESKPPAPVPPKTGLHVGVDLDTLANLIANKVSEGIEVPQQSGIIYQGVPTNSGMDDSFDDTFSMDQLAQSMVVQRGDKSSNFEDLGGVKKTKQDNKKTNNTIDLLSDLED